jgi:L-asparaginase
MAEADSRPAVAIRSLGGTVAMTSQPGHGARPSLDAGALLDAVPGLQQVASIDATAWAAVPSASLTIEELLGLLNDLEKACESGAEGAVVTTGTDTMEEVGYLIDLLWCRAEPVVVTGAMRAADAAGADGPANLLSAVTVAASRDARDRGCLVVMNDEVHSARSVRKLHTTSTAAFGSPSTGPAGRVQEGRARFHVAASARCSLDRPRPDAPLPRVALLRVTLGDDIALLDCALERYDGLVVEAFGAGHVPTWWADPLIEAAGRMPVVLASRTGAGSLLECTYGFVGSEQHLLDGGLISAGSLDGPKARILLTLSLAAGPGRASEHFHRHGTP